MLDINHIAKTFNPGLITEKRALAEVDLHLEEGDFVTMIGGNAPAGIQAREVSGARVPRPDERHGGNDEH